MATNLDLIRNARWQDVGALILGVWLFLSPWILGFTDTGLVATNAWVFGVIVAALALLAIFAYQQWEEWLNAAIGIWVFVSPWVLGMATNANVLWNSLIVGALLVVLALWSSSLSTADGSRRAADAGVSTQLAAEAVAWRLRRHGRSFCAVSGSR